MENIFQNFAIKLKKKEKWSYNILTIEKNVF